MNKRTFIYFGLAAIVLVIVVPLWAFNRDGSAASSPQRVAASDQQARKLFRINCGTCHTLARAGTNGVVGPNLDLRLTPNGPAADPEAIKALEGRVLTAIQQGVGEGTMPAGILQGGSATTVANFVARVAGR